MANKTIDDLTVNGTLTGSDTLELWQPSEIIESRKMSLDNLKGYLLSDVEFISASDNYTITSEAKRVFLTFTRQATDKTITLKSAISSIGQQFYIKIIGSGVGNVSLIGDNINDIVATSWIWHGTGLLKIESNGTDYEAINNTWDVGSNSNGVWEKNIYNEMIQRTVTSTLTTSGLLAGSIYASTTTTINFPIAFISNPSVLFGVSGDGGGVVCWPSSETTPTTTQHSTRLTSYNNTNTGKVYASYLGPWA